MHECRDAVNGRSYYRAELGRFHKLNIPEGRSVLQVGCGTGRLLDALKPSRGVGIESNPETLCRARQAYPHLEFIEGDAERLDLAETFDYIVLCNVLGGLRDISEAFRRLRRVVRPDTRIIITYYNYVWEPLIGFAEKLGMKTPQPHQNWLGRKDTANFLELAGFDIVRDGTRILLPVRVPLLSSVANRLLAKLPVIRHLALVDFVIARPAPVPRDGLSVSVIIPTRNERGNIRGAVERTPPMGAHTELIFVDGDSADGTVEEIERLIEEYRNEKDITLIRQVPPGGREAHTGKMLALGKGDAVRKGFDAAKGDVLMILDSDLTVPPEDLPKFHAALAEGHGELINGTRLVYPMEKQAMRFLNALANKAFSLLFTWLLEQRIKDTLCGTKAILKRDYEAIRANRAYFGDFDPFGDFDLLFGAAKLNLRIREIPIRYRARTYGEIKIERWKHGLLLLRMCWIALRKLKLS